ncbi:MAG: Eco29kI family restriction endonuclease [Chloroflexota bacterium]|nr:Eco29kI family restriction endonuclease [Chloroflexota bacterium]
MGNEQESAYKTSDIVEYNPADLANLVRYCVQELMTRQPYSLDLPGPFNGAGIYALFYDGDFAPYQHPFIRSPDASRPIYVGRARLTKSSGLRPLYIRLRDHADSIRDSENLNLLDFRCRFLILHPLWVSTIEDLLIEHYESLWNTVITGFGVHDPGGKRHTGKLPIWDALHPGRPHQRQMIARGAEVPDSVRVAGLVEDYARTRQPPPSELTHAEVQSALIDDNDDEIGDKAG